jgi:hypothetical protein
MNKPKASPIVDKSARAIWWLREHTLHSILKRRWQFLWSDPGIELWVLSSLILSALAFITSPLNMWGAVAFFVIGALRLYEISVNAIHITIFYGYIDIKPLASRQRMVLLLLLNFAEIVLWFAFSYRFFQADFTQTKVVFALSALAYSFVSASGVGSAPIYPTSNITVSLSLLESGIGLFMVIAVLARFVSLLPTPPEDSNANIKSHLTNTDTHHNGADIVIDQ